jgi:serine/threonine protein kinase
MLTVHCPHCRQPMMIREALAGQQVRCPRCSGVARAPQPGPSSPGAVPPSKLPTPPPSAHSRPDSNAYPQPAPDGLPPAPGGELDFSRILAPPQQAGEMGRIGSYRVLKVLGRGGMGVVFQAEDIQLARPVALKVLRPELNSASDGRARFLREAQAAAALQHDHIVTVFQVGEDRGVLFLALQLLEGETLEDRLQREPRLALQTILRLGREIADGLAAAHARHLVHRDIKPSNIWLEAGRDRVKILDFGLARALGEDARVTQTGAVIGTPAYMSPEQARGQAVGPRGDLFSLGCVLYRLCTGQPPFGGSDTLATLSALALEEPPPVEEFNPAVPPELSELIDRLLAKNPADRPASAWEVVEALREIEQAILGAVTLVPSSVPALRTTVGRAGSAPDTTSRLPDEAARRRRWWIAAAADVAALILLLSGLFFLFRTLVGG